MRESGTRNNEIVVPSVSKEVFLALLCYLYTDDLPSNSASQAPNSDPNIWLTDLLILANQYMLDGLKVKCCELIGETLSASNLVSLMNLASIHEATELKKACIYYFYTNLPLFLRDCCFEPDPTNDGPEALGYLIVDYFTKVAKLGLTEKPNNTTTSTSNNNENNENNNSNNNSNNNGNNNNETDQVNSAAEMGVKEFNELVSLFSD
ncbi:hypothetical protein DICPUDRAFT_92621 [Dictyostelium purpureum]|uniref:Uncharacterized protein n=1 Tax=Dictyostelium purpureum TaxID=5786 RepID=F0ZUS3_DICPU|nr:uncharacterized protein DICPUDRAFT_92621 [Dictyostelium purpureum]EGC32289.1 hypothetical protein DICPUDRAFT_92621 [Dictyostelium purpureum]|eukprot:XP_003291167.1 hypothetical protein DICPUDRAFT_92621 [Dictyostelium purpureum]